MQALNPAQIERIEQLARAAEAQPQAYRRKVILLAWLGYTYFTLLASAALGLGGLVVYAIIASHKLWLFSLLAKFFWAPFALVVLLGRVFFLRLQPPSGVRITAQEAPQLFAEIEAIRAQLQSQPIYAVLISGDFNAAVASLPRLGVLGWPRHYLLLGLPLLQQLDRASLRAVLAHEFGHLSRAHTRTGHWIYRLRLSWELILNQLSLERSWSLWLVRPFLSWYAPYFNAYSFVFARSNEYEADQCAVSVAGRDAMARALGTIHSLADSEQRFWGQLEQRAFHEKEAPQQVLRELQHALNQISPAQRWARIQQGLKEQTAYHDTHPSLSARLSAIAAAPQLLETPPEPSAAAQLLGTALAALTQQLEQNWLQHAAPSWQQQYQAGQVLRQKQQTLEEKAAHGALTADEECQLGLCLLELHRPKASDTGTLHATAVEATTSAPQFSLDHPAFQHFRRALELQADHPDALFQLGQALIGHNDPAGEALLQRAVAQKPMLRLPSAQALLHFAMRTKSSAEHVPYYNEFSAAQEEMQHAFLERNQLSTADRFAAHGLAESAQEQIKQVLQQHPEIQAAYLARKHVKLYPEAPCYVLALKSKKKHSDYQELGSLLTNSLDDNAHLVFFTESDAKELYHKVRKVKGAVLFERKKGWFK